MFINNKNIKIGLALSGGGARGLSHIGVIKALKEKNIPIDIISGSSAGALIGGLYLAQESILKVEKIAKEITLKDFIKLLGGITSLTSVIRGKKLDTFLNKYCQDKKIEDLKIPFVPVATDLVTGNDYIIKTGSLSKAIRASCAIPGLFEGVKYSSKLLVDGAISLPVPVRAAKKLGATFVIAVSLYSYSFDEARIKGRKKPRIPSLGTSAINMMQYNLAQEQYKEADITIFPDVANIPSLNLRYFIKGEDIIEKGYEAALETIPIIEDKLKNISN